MTTQCSVIFWYFDTNELWRTLPPAKKSKNGENNVMDSQLAQKLGIPESNLLYFLEKNSPVL